MNKNNSSRYKLIDLISVPLYLALWIFTIPWWIPATIREIRFRRRMQKLGRFVKWNDLEAKLSAGEGTLILEFPAQRVWWTCESVRNVAPMEIPADDATEKQLEPFSAWCFERYVEDSEGLAKHTVPPFSGYYVAESFKRLYPKLDAINIVKSSAAAHQERP